MQTSKLDEEQRALLKRIIERQGWRQLLVAHIRGQGVKYAGELDHKLELAEDLLRTLRRISDVQKLASSLGSGDLVSGVRDRLERFAYPASRLELAVCLFLGDQAERAGMHSYVESVSSELAAIARTTLEGTRARSLPADGAFVEFCAEEKNRPHAQQLFNRWLGAALLSLGRPDSHGDGRAVALGLRTRRCADAVRDFLGELKPFLDATGLSLPDAATLGIELPREPTVAAKRS